MSSGMRRGCIAARVRGGAWRAHGARVIAAAVLAALGGTPWGARLTAGEPFDYFRNSWALIGLKDYPAGVRVAPDNRLLLAGGREVRLRYGAALAPLGTKLTRTLLGGWLPVVLVETRDGDVHYQFTFWASPLANARDWQRAFDWPVEGDDFLCWVSVKVVNTGAQAAAARVAVEGAGPGVKASGPFSWELAPGEAAEGVLCVPFAARAREDAAPSPTVEEGRLWLERTVAYWRGRLAGAATIEVPCAKASQALRAAHVCQLITSDLGEVHGGEGFYDEFYIRDGAYQLLHLEEAGFPEEARRAVEFFLARQREDGRFESQAGQFDANGQAVWALWQYYQITGDRAWLERVYPAMRKAAAWTAAARRLAAAESPCAGLLPAAVADGENLWDGSHHIVGYDLWNLRGMLCTAEAAAALGRDAEGAELLAEAASYRAAVEAAWARTGLAYLPPSWEKEGTHWGNTETLWPTALFEAGDARVTALLDEVRHRFRGGFVEGTIRWGDGTAIHPYLSAYTTMASLARGEGAQVVEDFYWYLLHSSAAHAFPEGVFFRRRHAWSDTIPHGTGASNYAILLRHMLVHEQGGVLHLLPAVPDDWLGDGREIRVERAPTHFGPLTLATRGTAAGVEIHLDPPRRRPPQRIVLHLPRSRPPTADVPGVEIALRSEQARRWDWGAVVALYEEQFMPRPRPIPGLVSLPLPESPAAGARWQMLDVAAAANTDPFRAPFGVPNPGRYRFAGLKTGDQVVAGVPFRVLDPAANQGRALVVLHSPRAPQDRPWPREVEIPVGASGRRLFFLGNVHGWAADDAGVGEWGAVAEYVICYADGQEQTVPLITGRTCDDWALPPDAEDVYPGLRGEPWHLNVLGVELRPERVERIIFRGLGAQAAALLAAVTLEQTP